jgi:GDP-L-fucose synthase
LARAAILVLELKASLYNSSLRDGTSHLNVGSGEDLSIRDLAMLICKVVGFNGDLVFDHHKPDGTPRKLLNVDILNSLGWQPEITLEDGLAKTYDWFLNSGEAI